MACHTVHYDTTALGRLVPFLRVFRIMEPLGSRSSARTQAARDKEEEERKAGAVSDNDAEDADEDSEGPGSNQGRAHLHGLLRSRAGFGVLRSGF